MWPHRVPCRGAVSRDQKFAEASIDTRSARRRTRCRAIVDDKQVVGSYLVIESVSAMDYGEYVCEISNGIDEEVLLVANIYRSRPVVFGVNTPELLWRRPLLFTILVIFILFSLIALYVRCWMSMALFCRDFVRRRCENDGKDFDAIVCFHEKDSDLATNNIIPTLEFKYKYKCITLELTHLTQHCKLSLRLVKIKIYARQKMKNKNDEDEKRNKLAATRS
uniref:Ig-like domain-containing protein n=1 Tax=Trichogramma kaykai TaxID=54128 RepID=A0ABD2WSW7_9HYME